ncbi:hypothetical protein C8F01DRAFT_1311440 [Mycena amicta]|nr:hypothetical protein C8F01DRAFT_1311440 [Mycena amicta]
MHPSYRTSYFDKMDWPDSWKKTAIDLVCNEWVTHYKVVETSSTGTSAVCVPRSFAFSFIMLARLRRARRRMPFHRFTRKPSPWILSNTSSSSRRFQKRRALILSCGSGHNHLTRRRQHLLPRQTMQLSSAWPKTSSVRPQHLSTSSGRFPMVVAWCRREGTDSLRKPFT